MMAPAVPLQAWQKRYVEDHSRRKLLVKSVQVGGSFAASLEVSLDTVEHGGLWIMLSASDRQSMELMEKVKVHTAGWGVVVDTGFFSDTSIVQHTARFPNRGRIIALPANADTARGFSGNVLLDEFAIHRDAKAIWKAMVGRTMRGFKLRVLSSFKGKNNKFYELAKECGLHEGTAPAEQPVQAGVWSGHWVDIHMAVREGLAVDVDELRRTVNDDDIFMEEFECIPIDSALDFIGLELIQGCEVKGATTEFDFVSRPGQFAGYDIARRRDLSIIWVLSQEPNGLLTRGIISMPRMRFAEQKEIASKVAACVEKFNIDATGIGANLAEDLKEEFPGVVEPITFTGPIKETLATNVKTRMEDRTVGLPENAIVRRSIQAVKRFVTPAGNIRFDAQRTDAGHADEFWALALAIEAASGARNYVPAGDCHTSGRTVMGNLMEAAF